MARMTSSGDSAKPRPNVLLITTDQQHYAALGSHSPALSTPNIDSLGEDGVTFGRAYCANPLCTPSRASLLTGQYPSSHGAWTLGTKLTEDATTLPLLLGEAGYSTFLIGKAHLQPLASTPDVPSIECQPILRDLDFWRDFTGPWYGFEHIELARNHADESHVGQHYAAWLEDQGCTDWERYFQPWPPQPGSAQRRHAWDLPVELHYSTWTAERTIAAIDRATDAGVPFFGWASFHDPHPPYLVPEPYASMYDPGDCEPPTSETGELASMAPWFAETQESAPDFSPWMDDEFGVHGFVAQRLPESELRRNLATYYGMMTLVDDCVGRILQRLTERGLADNTLVIFTTDHGHFLGQHGLTAKGPFHYEDLIRVPFLMRWPERLPQALRTDALLSLVDVAPTVLRACGVPVPRWMQGVDQSEAAGGGEAARQVAIVENRSQPRSVVLRTYVFGDEKLTLYEGRPWGDLFDLANDPDERANRFADPEWRSRREQLIRRALDAEFSREVLPWPRVAIA